MIEIARASRMTKGLNPEVSKVETMPFQNLDDRNFSDLTVFDMTKTAISLKSFSYYNLVATLIRSGC